VHLWEGSDDHTGIPEHHQFLQQRIKLSTLTVVENEGHISLLARQAKEILAPLLG